MKSITLFITFAALAITSGVTQAAFIYHDTASTTAGTFSGFPLTNLKNSGHDSHLDTENAALASQSYATANPPTGGFPVTITLDFTSAVDLTKFYLWNHSNNNTAGAVNAGMEEFTLTFLDAASGGGSQIGLVYGNTATAAPATGTYVAQIFNFGSTYNDVRSAKLTIASRIDEANQFVAIRELGFEAIPEPGSVLLGSLGMLVLLRRRR